VQQKNYLQDILFIAFYKLYIKFHIESHNCSKLLAICYYSKMTKQSVKKNKPRVAKNLGVFMVIFTRFILPFIVIIGVILVAYVRSLISNLPSYTALMYYDPPKATMVFDANRELIGEISKEKRVFISINNIPEKLKQAFIAAEDKTFYTNPGIDLQALLKAITKNIISTLRVSGDRYIGASTITQQVVRNVLISNERTIQRKIKEFVLAYQVAKTIPKDKILEIYLNQLYLGSHSYGVVAAAYEYFGKTLNQLTLEEMATLASLPKAPSAIDPTKNMARAMERRNWVMQRMLIEGYITEHEYNEAKEKPITLVKRDNTRFGNAFIEYIRSQMIKDGFTDDEIQTSGLRINSTMNAAWQKIAQKELDIGLVSYDRKHGYRGAIARIDVSGKDWVKNLRATDKPSKINQYIMAAVLSVSDREVQIGFINQETATIAFDDLKWAKKFITPFKVAEEPKTCSDVVSAGDVVVVSPVDVKKKLYKLEQIPEIEGSVLIMSPKNGNIYAMVGGYADIPGTFNRATQSTRQIGSTVKTFVGASALLNGITPSDIFMDSPLSFNLGNGEVWTPQNSSKKYLGPVPFHLSFELSLNTTAIRITDTVGLGKVLRTIDKFGGIKYGEPNLSIVIGAAEATLLDVCKAYSSFASGGLQITPIAVRVITYDDGRVAKKQQSFATEKQQTNEQESDKFDIIKRLFDRNDDQDAKKYASEDDWITTNRQQTVTSVSSDERIMSPEIAYQMVSMLKAVAKRGTAARYLSAIDLPLAGKTGTSQNGKDLWFVGFTPEVTIGVWIGYDAFKTTGDEYGATVALPIFANIATKLAPYLGKRDFIPPAGIQLVKVNRWTGKRTNLPISNDVNFVAFKSTDPLPPYDNAIKTNSKNVVAKTNDIDFGHVY
jgi:penicillin-binding protein 1A